MTDRADGGIAECALPIGGARAPCRSHDAGEKAAGAFAPKVAHYRPEIDGLRAIAVLAVLLFHANRLAPGGYVGVDVFFVISGYLITGIIRKELDAGKFHLSNFWERRIRRIFPAQAVLVSAVLLIAMLFELPADMYDLSKSALAQSAFLSNVYFLRKSGYFDGPSELKPLLHMWSLAVEEQFYLVFPLLLVACARFRCSMRRVLAFLAALSFALSVWGLTAFPSATFFLLPTRAWELLVGALLTFCPRVVDYGNFKRMVCEMGSGAGLCGIVASAALFDDTTLFPGAAALLPCGGAALIIGFTDSTRTLVGRLLGSRPLVFVGLISYSLYLWHWPALAFARYLFGEVLDGWTCLAAVAAGFFLAYLSWRYVETPFRYFDCPRYCVESKSYNTSYFWGNGVSWRTCRWNDVFRSVCGNCWPNAKLILESLRERSSDWRSSLSHSCLG